MLLSRMGAGYVDAFLILSFFGLMECQPLTGVGTYKQVTLECGE